MAAAVPNTDITTMLGSLMEIICKYEEKDPENMPNEGDYLLAMNTLKALNDRKGNFTAVQRQVIIQMRDRIRRVPNILEITNRHAGWMMKKLKEYVTCDICGSQLVDEYSLNRHKKRQNCRTTRARVFFFSAQFQIRKARWEAKGCFIDFPFVAAMFQIHEDTRPQILMLPEVREFTWSQHMMPRRIIPRHLWESMWSTTAQSVNPRYCFKFETAMFCHNLKRDGPTGFARLFRHSIITQAATIFLSDLDSQLRLAQAMLRPNPSTGRVTEYAPRQWEAWNVNVDDMLPMLKMTIAPAKRPRFRCVPENINKVAGANPSSEIFAETTGFSDPLAVGDASPVPAAQVANEEGEEDSDNSEVSLNI